MEMLHLLMEMEHFLFGMERVQSQKYGIMHLT
jgi:hypothetical protein